MQDNIHHHLRNYYNLSRPWEYYGFSILITTLGLLLAGTTDPPSILRIITANFFACMFIFVLNDIEDREYDALDEIKRHRNPLAGKVMKLEHAKFFCWALFLLSLFLFISINLNTLLCGFLLLLLGFLYSWKTVQLKSKPVLDLVSHGLYFGPLLLLSGFSTSSSNFTYNTVFLSIAVFVLSVIGDIKNEIRDYEVDRLSGITNTATILDLARYKKMFSLITLILVAYIFFYVVTTLPTLFTLIIVLYSTVHSFYFLYLLKFKRIQVYEYGKRNVLYIGYALVILLYLLTL